MKNACADVYSKRRGLEKGIRHTRPPSGRTKVQVPKPSPVSLDEATQHLVEFRGMFSVREMAGAIENIHARIMRVPRDEVEERITLIDGGRRVVVGPGEQCGFAKAAVANNTERFVFLPREMR